MRVHHIAIQVADLERMATFYRDLLGLTPIESPRADARWFDASGTILMLERCDGSPSDEPFVTPRTGFHVVAFAIHASQRSGMADTFNRAGVHIERETAYSLFVRDPEGNRIALSHYPEAV